MNQMQTEIKDTVLGFTKFGLFLVSFIIMTTGIELINIGEFLFGGIAVGQFIVWCFFSRSLFGKLDEKR